MLIKKNPRNFQGRCGAEAALFFVNRRAPAITVNTTCLDNSEMTFGFNCLCRHSNPTPVISGPYRRTGPCLVLPHATK
jgi:hypothetical protein